jgi:hypothetical protein
LEPPEESAVTEADSQTPGTAFYCVSDARYFLGAVGLVNSLRLLGHREKIFLLDCGLMPEQSRLLDPHVTLVRAPSNTPPTLLKEIAPLRHPAESMVLIDTDVVVTRPLTELIGNASRGHVVAFKNDLDRFVPAWGEVLDLGPVRRQPYLSFAFVAMGGSLGVQILRLIEDRQTRIDFDQTYWRKREMTDYPLLFADQDVLNAILASRVGADRVIALEQRLAALPPFNGLTVSDERLLGCAYEDGVEPYLLHHWLVKPWLERTHDGAYSRLLRRLLVSADVAVRVPESQLPLWMRTGLLAYADRKRVDAREFLRYHVREPISASLGKRARLNRERIADGDR